MDVALEYILERAGTFLSYHSIPTSHCYTYKWSLSIEAIRERNYWKFFVRFGALYWQCY